MDIMRHGHTYEPKVGRTPGGFDHPVPTLDEFPSLPAATGVTVGVVDTGLVLREGTTHPWFGDHVSFGEEDEDRLQQGNGDAGEPVPLSHGDGHGTFVTGLILREAPTARVIMRGALAKLRDDQRESLGNGDDVEVAEAVRSLADDLSVQVINLSFGGGVFTDRKAAGKLAEALEELKGRVAVVAAAGNDASTQEVYPAAFGPVIAVGALDESATRPTGARPARAGFSNYGAWVDAYAGGVQVLGPYVAFDASRGDDYGLLRPEPFWGWARWSGTSFAAAIVSGRIAQTAIERGITGVEAADALLGEAPTISELPVWVQGTR